MSKLDKLEYNTDNTQRNLQKCKCILNDLLTSYYDGGKEENPKIKILGEIAENKTLVCSDDKAIEIIHAHDKIKGFLYIIDDYIDNALLNNTKAMNISNNIYDDLH